MPDNKIQDIANEITAYKPNTTLSLVKAVLEDLNAPSELLFSDNVSIYPDQNDPRILKVSGLLPNKKYEINGVKFTADSGGIATIEDKVFFLIHYNIRII